MADIGGITKQTLETINQEVVEPTVDQVGLALEQGVQSVMGNFQAMDPQKQADIKQKEADDQKEADEVRWRLSRMQQTEQEIEAIRKKRREEEDQKNKSEQQNTSEVQQFEVVHEQQKQEDIATQNAKTKTEMRKGVAG